MPIVMAVTSGGLEADGGAADDVRGRTGLGRLGDLLDGAEAAGRVVLGDVDEGDAGREADDAGEEELDPVGRPTLSRLEPLVFIIT